MSQLSILIPDRIFALHDGTTIRLKPFKFKQFSIALELIQKYVEICAEFTGETTYPEVVQAILGSKNQGLMDDIANLLMLVSWVDKKSITREFLDELGHDEIIWLLTETVKMNMDFFGRVGKQLQPDPEDIPEAEPRMTGELESAA